jgi:hypothetical protein
MKVFAKIELPISIDAAYDKLISGFRDDSPAAVGISSRVLKEVGDLGPGTVIETVFLDKKVTTTSEIIENIRPNSLIQKSSTNKYDVVFTITLERAGSTTILMSCTEITFKNFLQNLIISQYSSSIMRSRHYLDTYGWGYLFPDKIIKAKYSSTVLGLPYFLVAAPIFFAFVFIMGKLYEHLHG